MAIVAMIVFFGVLAGAALLILESWNEDEVPLHMRTVPGAKGALGDAVAVSPQRRLAVSSARPAPPGAARLVSDMAATAAERTPHGRAAISPARVVAASAPSAPAGSSPPPAPAPEPEPEPVPDTPPVPVPVATPVSIPSPAPTPVAGPVRSPTGSRPGPVAAGGGEPEVVAGDLVCVCEGDDYTWPLSPLEATEGSEVPPPVVSHDLTVYFGGSDEGAGFHLVLFDGLPVEIGDDPVPAEPGKRCAQVDLGPLLGEPIEAGAELHVEAVTLGEASEPAVP